MKRRKRRVLEAADKYITWLAETRGWSEHEASLYADPEYAAKIRAKNERRSSISDERAALHDADRTDSDRKWDRVWKPCPIRHYRRGNCTLPQGHSGRCSYNQFDIEGAIAEAEGEENLSRRTGDPLTNTAGQDREP